MNTKTIDLSELNYSIFNKINTEPLRLMLIIDEQDLDSEVAKILREPPELVKFRFIGHRKSDGEKKFGMKYESYTIDSSKEEKDEIISYYQCDLLADDLMRDAPEQSGGNSVNLYKCDLYSFNEIKSK